MCHFTLKAVYVKFTAIMRMFQMSEYTKLRLLSFLKSNAKSLQFFSGIAQWSVFKGRFLSCAKERVEQVAQISVTKKHL